MTKRNPNWSQQETLLALYMMIRLPIGKVSSKNPEIERAARSMGTRTPKSLKMKVFNLYSLLPEDARSGWKSLVGCSGLDKEIIKQYLDDPDEMRMRATKAAMDFGIKLAPEEEEHVSGTDAERVAKIRLGQAMFRSRLLQAYDGKCCVSEIDHEEMLEAGHIKPWKNADPKERVDPANGLLLNALLHKAFDRGLIAFDKNCALMLSPALPREAGKQAIRDNFEAYEGKGISLPADERDRPGLAFIDWHRREVFRRSASASYKG